MGWLETGKPYSTGTVPAVFVEKLKTVQEAPWMNVCLGVHECDLRPEEEAPEGNGEVRIPGVPGVAHAAPFLITHYITHTATDRRRSSSMPFSPPMSNSCWSRAERTYARNRSRIEATVTVPWKT
ncbi:DUF7919 family protein [Streptomyces cinereoruber]